MTRWLLSYFGELIFLPLMISVESFVSIITHSEPFVAVVLVYIVQWIRGYDCCLPCSIVLFTFPEVHGSLLHIQTLNHAKKGTFLHHYVSIDSNKIVSMKILWRLYSEQLVCSELTLRVTCFSQIVRASGKTEGRVVMSYLNKLLGKLCVIRS